MRLNHLYLLLFWFAILICCANTRNVLKILTTKKNVKTCSVEIISQPDVSNYTWIEYRYIFNTSKVYNVPNKTLKIGFFENLDAPFDCKLSPKSAGYSFNLIQILSDSLQFNYEIIKISRNATITKLLNNHVDLIACHPTVKQTSKITRLWSTMRSRFVVIYKVSRLHVSKDIFILTFSGTLWLCFLLTFILLALCMRISTMQYFRFDTGVETWSWVEITLWVIAAACQQGLSYSPRRFTSCCIFFLGYLMAYLLYTGFAAAITSVLVRQEDVRLHRTRLSGYNVIAYGLNPASKDFEGMSIKKHVGSIIKLFHELETHYTIGIGPQLLFEQWNLSEYSFMNIDSRIQYRRGFLVRSDGLWYNLFNKMLRKIEQTGILQSLMHRNCVKTNVAMVYKNDYSSASLEHVGSASYFLAAGCVASLILLIIECLIYKYIRYLQNRRTH